MELFLFSLRLLWTLYLLIGSISCVPTGKEYSTGVGNWFSESSTGVGNWFSGGGVSSDPGSSSSLPSLPKPSSDKLSGFPAPQDALSSSGPGTYRGLNMAGGNEYYSGYAGFRDESYKSPEVGHYVSPYAAPQPSGYGDYGYGGYASSPTGYVGDVSYGFAPGDDWSSGSATSHDETPELVFSDVTFLEPVYSANSRSRYQRGRRVFAQTRYTPVEPVRLFRPAPRPVSKPLNQKSVAEPPTKGGF
ncbi:hypothetical protein PAMA_018929 [Pampus argenteus]